jgi:hypothetical protein
MSSPVMTVSKITIPSSFFIAISPVCKRLHGKRKVITAVSPCLRAISMPLRLPGRSGCGDDGIPSFNRIRYRQHDASVFLYAFDLIELDGE